MIEHNNKIYYSCRELADMTYKEDDKTKDLVSIWREVFNSHDNFKDISSSQFQVKLMPLARGNKIPHLECTKSSIERKYYFFNIEDIINRLKDLSIEESNMLVKKFSKIELVEAK